MDLLTAPTFSALVDGKPALLSLPGCLRALSTRDRVEFTALRPHQQHAWHSFSVQLAALVFHEQGSVDFDFTEESWRAALANLADEAAESAWRLVEADLSQPAFFQSPVPEGSLAAFKNELHHPDDLDIVVTTRNHDVKQNRLSQPRPEHWAFALITLQTMQGFFGAGNYGVSRMNGGFSSRPAVSIVPSLHAGERFRRDTQVLLGYRTELAKPDGAYGYPNEGGLRLSWTVPWDGSKSVNPLACDPFYVEICRRIRLKGANESFHARTASSQKAFLDAKERNGDTGDIWTPIELDEKGAKAITVGPNGFDYRLLHELLFEPAIRSRPALELSKADGAEPLVLAQVLVRGQGTTDGYRERVVPFGKRALSILSERAARERAGQLSAARIQSTRQAQLKVLKPAILTLLQGAPEKLDFRDDRADRWIRGLDQRVDQIFFHSLADAIEQDMDDGEANRSWHSLLLSFARDTYRNAEDTATIPLSRRERALARGAAAFWGSARRQLGAAEDFNRDTPQLKEIDA